MEQLVGFFEWIVEFFSAIGDFISSFISSLLTSFSLIASATTLPAIFSTLLPDILLTAMICLISISVLKFVVGR